MHDDYGPAVDDWIAMLSISTRLTFPRVRERAIKEITSRLEEIDPFDLIGVAVKYDVQQWLKPAYRTIVTRKNLVTHTEAGKIAFPMAVMLMRSREQHWKNGDNFASQPIAQAPTPFSQSTKKKGGGVFGSVDHHSTHSDTRLAADHIIDSEVKLMEQVSGEPAVRMPNASASV